ncbi:15202_t:CDS:1, partial [Racocetra persica]
TSKKNVENSAYDQWVSPESYRMRQAEAAASSNTGSMGLNLQRIRDISKKNYIFYNDYETLNANITPEYNKDGSSFEGYNPDLNWAIKMSKKIAQKQKRKKHDRS